MNRGLIIRAFREAWPSTLLLGVVIAIVELALGYVLPKFGGQFADQWVEMEFARGMLQAMLGAEIGNRFGAQMFHAIAWAHPVVITLTFAHAIISATRVPAGEVDRGTADVVFGLPVSRWEIYLSETFVWLCSALALLLCALAGNTLGGTGLPSEQRPVMSHVLIVLLNLFCLYGVAGGLTWLVSSLSDRRGRAMTIVFVILLALVLLDYLAQFWQPLEHFVFLSPLYYHRPAGLLMNGVWPWRDMAVLFTTGAILWLTGGVIFARRNLCTV